MRRSLVAASIACLSGAPAFAQAPPGREFTVSSSTSQYVTDPAIASAPDGGFVVVWVWRGTDSSRGIAARRFDARGAALGAELQMSNHTTAALGGPPRVAADVNGFTIVWAEFQREVHGRRFDASGTPVGAVFQANTYTTGIQGTPGVGSDAAGNFVVVWDSQGQDGDGWGVFGQRFDAAGARRGGEFAVNTITSGNQLDARVAMNAGGEFMVTWDRQINPGPPGVRAQGFSATGIKQGPEIMAGDTSLALGSHVSASAGGAFMVTWNEEIFSTQLVARQFSAFGEALGPRLPLHDTHGPDLVPAFGVAIDGQGRFAVAWVDDRADSSATGILAHRFLADGTPFGQLSTVNTVAEGRQEYAVASADSDGRTVVAWRTPVAPGSAFTKVVARRYGLVEPYALLVDTAASASSDGNGALEAGETVDFRPTWLNNTSTAIPLTGSIALTGPPPGTYSAADATGGYGTVAGGAAVACTDCYAVQVAAPQRPLVHWDATATEVMDGLDPDAHGWRVHIGESFTDVPRSSPFYRFVETLLHREVTAGCAGSVYCPSSSTTREQMAVFVLVAKEGVGYAPPACTVPIFSDVPASSAFCRWIEDLARRGVIAGCAPGLFCPTAAVSREQMAVFVLRTLDPSLDPPACTTPVFDDVPATSPFCRWIEELARRGVVSGCAPQRYCPADPVTREQMAVFLTGTFGLTLYGP